MRLLYSFAIIVAWAAIYLPGLGTRELQGEEARRILPGRTMIQTGDFIVPRSGGKIYNRKPPLVNWVSAAGISLTGSMDEWTARLPSTFAVLLLALTTFFALRSWLGAETSLLAAFILLTNVGFVEKGRLIEIEALYFSLYGIALVLWLGLRAQGREVASWLACGLVSGIAFLAKGPPHLIYLYVIIVSVLWREGRLRELLRWPHLGSLGLFFGTWLPWAVANMLRNPAKNSASEWSLQITHRLGFAEFDFGNYLLQVPQSWVNFLPWALLVPLWFAKTDMNERNGKDADGMIPALRLGTLIGFFIIALLPSSRPRFMLPCNVSAAVLTAYSLANMLPSLIARISVPWRWLCTIVTASCAAICIASLWNSTVTLAPTILALLAALVASAFLVGSMRRWCQAPLFLGVSMVLAASAVTATFAAVVAPRMAVNDDLRPFANEVRAITGTEDRVVLFRVGEKMWPFYLGMKCVEITDLSARPRPTRWLIMPQEVWQQARIKREIVSRLQLPLRTCMLISPKDQTPLVLCEFSPNQAP